VLKSGKALAAVAPSMTSDDAKAMKDVGVTALMVSSDINLLKSAAANELKGFKALYGA
jgi:2-keto-3-deoxy-L-rhamnonate aldolase RhmA